MNLEDGRFIESADKIKLYCKYWKPALDGDAPKALVFISHGYGEHCGYYEHVAAALTSQGYFVFSYDHEGHGQSGGEPVCVSSVDVYVRDVWQHIDDVKRLNVGIPLFIVGHSMGGLIAVLGASQRSSDLKGVALISAALMLDPNETGCCVRCMAGLLGRCCKNMIIGQEDPTFNTKNKEMIKRLEEDPLNFQEGLKAGMGLQLMLSMDNVWNHVKSVTCPLLIMHGTADAIVNISGSKKLAQEISSTDITTEWFEDAYHMVHFEPDGVAEKCVNKIVEWINERV